MKAESLMIGDWVKVTHLNKIGKVYRIDAANGDGNGWAALIDGDFHESNLEPIPLTEEFLVKNGFIKSEEDENDGCFDGLDYTFIPCKDGGYNCCFDKKRTISGHFDYVHELQQAFRLTGIKKSIIV